MGSQKIEVKGVKVNIRDLRKSWVIFSHSLLNTQNMSNFYSSQSNYYSSPPRGGIREVIPPPNIHDERPPSFHSSDEDYTHVQSHSRYDNSTTVNGRYPQDQRHGQGNGQEEDDDDFDRFDEDGPIRIGTPGYVMTEDGSHLQQPNLDQSFDGEEEWDEKSGDLEGSGFGGYGAYQLPRTKDEAGGLETDSPLEFQGAFGAPPAVCPPLSLFHLPL